MKDNFTFMLDEYNALCNQYCGICLNCEEIDDGIEPDAEGYKCPCCDSDSVMGIEQALITGNITLD